VPYKQIGLEEPKTFIYLPHAYYATSALGPWTRCIVRFSHTWEGTVYICFGSGTTTTCNCLLEDFETLGAKLHMNRPRCHFESGKLQHCAGNKTGI
jgi:hypothetical protein